MEVASLKSITVLEEKKWWKALLSIQGAILVTTSLLAAGIVTIGVVMRYILKVNFFGQEEILSVVSMWLYWVGGIYGSYTHTHISADLADTYIHSWKIRKILRIVVLVISLAVTAIFAFWGYQYTAWIWNLGGRSAGLKIPLILSKGTMFVGLLFMGLYSIYHLIRVIQSTEEDYVREGDS